jgi:hypothetical protein
MNLQHRIDLLRRLGEYILSDDPAWQDAKEKASNENSWFISQFVTLASNNIATNFLQNELLEQWSNSYHIPHNPPTNGKLVGIVMAGNIPLVGFHDLLSVFISGHRAHIKPSSKDAVLVRHLVEKMSAWDPNVQEWIYFSDNLLKGCDAYIATGNNNTAGYFQQYFGKYPNLIRRNRTSVAILDRDETKENLDLLADDVYLYFGLGCRNVTKLYVPRDIDFALLLAVFSKYNWMADHHKYKNNYDYNLAIHLLNRNYYMSNESLLLVENTALFSPISQLHFEYYDNKSELASSLVDNKDLQCIVGKEWVPFGASQKPSLVDYADGADTMAFLEKIS